MNFLVIHNAHGLLSVEGMDEAFLAHRGALVARLITAINTLVRETGAVRPRAFDPPAVSVAAALYLRYVSVAMPIAKRAATLAALLREDYAVHQVMQDNTLAVDVMVATACQDQMAKLLAADYGEGNRDNACFLLRNVAGAVFKHMETIHRSVILDMRLTARLTARSSNAHEGRNARFGRKLRFSVDDVSDTETKVVLRYKQDNGRLVRLVHHVPMIDLLPTIELPINVPLITQARLLQLFETSTDPLLGEFLNSLGAVVLTRRSGNVDDVRTLLTFNLQKATDEYADFADFHTAFSVTLPGQQPQRFTASLPLDVAAATDCLHSAGEGGARQRRRHRHRAGLISAGRR